MIKHQSAIMQHLAHNRADVVAASRFFNNDRVLVPALIQALIQPTARAVAQREVLVLQDTTELNYSAHAGRLRRHDPDLGPITRKGDVGLFLHPSLVIDAQTGFALGFADVDLYNRSWQRPDKHLRSYGKQPRSQKEFLSLDCGWRAGAAALGHC